MSHDLEAVYRQTIVMVRNRAFRILGDRAVAEDVAQYVFVNFMQRRRTRGAEHDAPSLLYRMVTNAALNHLRNMQRRTQLINDHAPPATSTRSEEPEDRVALRTVLARVSDEEAQVAAYYYIDGLLQDEIATLLRMERRTVGNRLETFRQRARRLLCIEENAHVA